MCFLMNNIRGCYLGGQRKTIFRGEGNVYFKKTFS